MIKRAVHEAFTGKFDTPSQERTLLNFGLI